MVQNSEAKHSFIVIGKLAFKSSDEAKHSFIVIGKLASKSSDPTHCSLCSDMILNHRVRLSEKKRKKGGETSQIIVAIMEKTTTREGSLTP